MIRLILLCSLFLFLSPAHAEQITIGVSKQSPEQKNINRPKRGMKATEVIQLFGEPTSQVEAKGNPPITTWHYPHFSVYLESDVVIHSVLKHQPRKQQP